MGDSQPGTNRTSRKWRVRADKGSGLRIEQGNPRAHYPSRRLEHVRMDYQRKAGGRHGQGPKTAQSDLDTPDGHIPLDEWEEDVEDVVPAVKVAYSELSLEKRSARMARNAV